MKAKTLLLGVVLISFPFAKSFADDGGDIFRTNCGACHTIGKGKLVGPDLKGVEIRHSEAWILKWVKSSQAMVQAGDKDAVKLFADNSNIPMPDQALSEDQVKIILGFIKASGQEDVVASAPVIVSDDNAATSQKTVAEEKSSVSLLARFSFTQYLLMSLLGFLLLIIYILGTAIKTLAAKPKEGAQV